MRNYWCVKTKKIASKHSRHLFSFTYVSVCACGVYSMCLCLHMHVASCQFRVYIPCVYSLSFGEANAVIDMPRVINQQAAPATTCYYLKRQV